MYASLGHPGTDWGQLHHEQAFTVSGELRVGGAVQHFEGIGYRDHGRGTRDVTRLGGDTMVFGVFPDGRSVGSLLAWTRDGTSVVNAGYLHDEDGFHPLSVERLPALVDPRGDPAMFRVLLALHDGTAVEIGVEILHSATLSIVEPNRWMIGADLAAEDPLVLVESPARLVIGDTMGYGNVERNCRRSRLGAAIFEQG
jgi:hypothetical protein